MLKKILRFFLPNPFDRLLKKAKRENKRSFLLAWNRGVGDIPLGLYAMVKRIRQIVPDAKISFLIRKNLQEGFSLFADIDEVYIAPNWQRGKPYDVQKTLKELQIDPSQFDVIIENPDPYYWVKWQWGKVVPKLQWPEKFDPLVKKFSLPKEFYYVGLQPITETNYNFFRNWPKERWDELFLLAEQKLPRCKFLLFGFEKSPNFVQANVIDLRGQTSLYEMLSIIKNKCRAMILPDSGILAMTYYLDVAFPLHLITLWADPNQGILRQNVASPNPELAHTALFAENGDLSTIRAEEVLERLVQIEKAYKG